MTVSGSDPCPHVRVVERNGSGTEQDQNFNTASRDAVQAVPSRAPTREAQNETDSHPQPGDDLNHLCATHSNLGEAGSDLCRYGRGCRSYCGIDLSVGSGWEWQCDDEDAPVTPDDCVVCESMWEAERA